MDSRQSRRIRLQLSIPHLHSLGSNVNAVEQSVRQRVSGLLDLDLGGSVFSVGVGINLSSKGDGDFLQ